MASQTYFDTSLDFTPSPPYQLPTPAPPPSQQQPQVPSPQTLQVSLSHFKPIIIPQVTKTFDGELFSPFMRAYPPILSSPNINIPQSTFLAFLDGLNEAFMANPFFQAAGTTGEIMGFFPMLEIPGLVLETTSEVGSEVTSYFRTRAYLRRANEGIFNPVGLRVMVSGFKGVSRVLGLNEGEVKGRMEMLVKVGEKGANGGNGGDASLSRNPGHLLLSALWNQVAPLETTNLPEPSLEKNRLKRWNASYAAREGAKQKEKLDKKYREAERKQAEKYAKAISDAQEKDREIAKLERKIEEVAVSGKSAEEKERTFEALSRQIEKIRMKRDEKSKVVRGEGDQALEKLTRKNMKKGFKMKFVVVVPLGRGNEWDGGDG